MLKSTQKIYKDYGFEAKKRASDIAKKTIEQLRREYLEAIFTAAVRRRFDIWDFTQKFMESELSLSIDIPEVMLSKKQDELFRDFLIYCTQNNVEVESVPHDKGGMAHFRDISPEAAWIVEIYTRWHSKTGEACCEIAERAPASLLKKIHKKAMKHPVEDVLPLLIDYSADAAVISSKDYDILAGETE